VKERERAAEQEVEDGKTRCVRGVSENGAESGNGYGKQIIRVHQYLNEFHRKRKRKAERGHPVGSYVLFIPHPFVGHNPANWR